jgi:hypothetical protein
MSGGWWYYNMLGDSSGTYGLYDGTAGNPAFSTFASAAQANGF